MSFDEEPGRNVLRVRGCGDIICRSYTQLAINEALIQSLVRQQERHEEQLAKESKEWEEKRRRDEEK